MTRTPLCSRRQPAGRCATRTSANACGGQRSRASSSRRSGSTICACTNATVLVAQNVDMKTAQIRLGHADPALTLRIYAQPTDHGDRAAAALIDEHFAPVLAAEADAPELTLS